MQLKPFTLPLLLLILVVAASLRFYNLNWDDDTFAHPDERSTIAFYTPTITWPENSDDLFDPRRSTLNPFWDVNQDSRRSYTYGHFPLYTLVLVAHGLEALAPVLADVVSPEWLDFLQRSLSTRGFAIIGRALMGLADLGIVLLLYLIGKRLYGVWGGLLAAALSTFTVLQIQLAHFFTVDTVSTTFTLLALYGAMLLYDRPSISHALLTGIGIGLAVASKSSALPIAFAPVAVAMLLMWQAARTQANGSDRDKLRSSSSVEPAKTIIPQKIIGLTMMALLMSFLIFMLTSPFVLLDFQNFYRAVIEEQGRMVSGEADFPFTRQYRGTTPYLYHMEQLLYWGMGWPLGLLTLAGTIWVIGKTVTGRASAGELLLLGWVVLYFGPTGLFLAKFMRYNIPVVPIFILFGAGLVMFIAQRSRLRPLAMGLAGVSVIGSALWALAFVNGVYGQEHPWVQFARWTYANVPEGSCIAWEHWDDRMPVSLPEPNANPGAMRYIQPQLPMYEEDTLGKFENLRTTLSDCDYIALATNRLWRTIPKLPERYPMSTRYYEALFSGELGYELVHRSETPPQLFGLVIDDRNADESFTVYDHPQPMMFKKVRQLSYEEWDALLGGLWEDAIPGYVGEPTLLTTLRTDSVPPGRPNEPINGKTLLLDQPVSELPVVDDFRWNSIANNNTVAAILTWWLIVQIIGLLAWPLTYLLFHRLPGRGYAFSKSLGLLLISYFVWLNSSLGLLQNRWSTAMIGLLFLLMVAIGLATRYAQNLTRFLRQNLSLILLTEIIFTLGFLGFVGLRLQNPDLWQPWLGGEKMLEIGFLNAIVKSAEMPPYDPFFADGIINYYYYGMFIVGVLIKLTGISPNIAFNLAVPMLAGLTAVNTFALAHLLAYRENRADSNGTGPSTVQPQLRAIVAGLLAVLFVTIMGNLEGANQFLNNLGQFSRTEFTSQLPLVEQFVRAASGYQAVIEGQELMRYNYWDPTRVIEATINEFPYFSYLFADLHPHMIGIPFTLLLMALAYNALRPPASRDPLAFLTVADTVWADSLAGALRWLAIPFVLGALAVINTWDLPTYLGLVTAGFMLTSYRRINQADALSFIPILSVLVGGLVYGIVTVGTTLLMYRPFFAHYQTQDVGLGFVHTQTPLIPHLKIWGIFLFIILSWLVLNLIYPTTRNGWLRAVSLRLRYWYVAPHVQELYRKLVGSDAPSLQLLYWLIAGTLAISAILALLGYTVPAYLLPLLVLSTILLLRPDVSPHIIFINLLAFTGFLLLLGVEAFFLRDFLGGGDYYRMNTLFKFFIQVWVMFGVVAGVAMVHLWSSWRTVWGQVSWQLVAAGLIFAGLIYPFFATGTRLDDRFPGPRPAIGTLDGLAYMTVGQFEWPAGSQIQLHYDYEAIQWLIDNVPGTPVLAEAKIGYYREGGMRVAAYTGLPSILGGLHQNEQRYGWQIGQRDGKVNEFWASADPDRTWELLTELRIEYVYVGQIEQITYGQDIDKKFEQLWLDNRLELVFENDKVRIYRQV